MGYSFWLAARVLLYAPSHRQDSTYHSLVSSYILMYLKNQNRFKQLNSICTMTFLPIYWCIWKTKTGLNKWIAHVLWCFFLYIDAFEKPKPVSQPNPVWATESSLSNRIQFEHLNPVWASESSLSIRIRFEHPNPVWASESSLNNWIQFEHLNPIWAPESSLNNRIQFEHPNPVWASESGFRQRPSHWLSIDKQIIHNHKILLVLHTALGAPIWQWTEINKTCICRGTAQQTHRAQVTGRTANISTSKSRFRCQFLLCFL